MMNPGKTPGFFVMADDSDFVFEYQYTPSPDAEERLIQAWDLILTLILEDIKAEQEGQQEPGGDTC
jgi:hypothetical protein